MRFGMSLGVVLLATAMLAGSGFARPVAPNGPLNTTADIRQALRGCWQWPVASDARSDMALTVRLSFKRNGEIFGARITYQTPDVSDEERLLYYRAVLSALARCSPLPVSASLGEAIAGRPMTFHIHDTRQQRKA
jgi:hypothetical protein